MTSARCSLGVRCSNLVKSCVLPHPASTTYAMCCVCGLQPDPYAVWEKQAAAAEEELEEGEVATGTTAGGGAATKAVTKAVAAPFRVAPDHKLCKVRTCLWGSMIESLGFLHLLVGYAHVMRDFRLHCLAGLSEAGCLDCVYTATLGRECNVLQPAYQAHVCSYSMTAWQTC